MATFIGIDLGSHSVKLAVFEGTLGRYALSEYRSRPVEQNGESGGLDPRLDALRALLDELPAGRAREMAVGFPSEWASIRLVELPFGDRTQVEKTLPFEVENQVPFDLDEMVLSSRILHVGADGSRVLAGLAAKSRIGPLLEGLKGLGADPRALVMDADLLGDFADGGVQAVVDVGHTRTLVTLCRDGHVIAARAISGGGADLTRALAERLAISWGRAETLKHTASVSQSAPTPAEATTDDDVPPDLFIEDTEATEPPRRAGLVAVTAPVRPSAGAVLREAAAPLLADIRATLISFEDTHHIEIDEVLACGGGAALDGLCPWLAAVLGVPVRAVHVSDEALAASSPGSLALCHALALKATRGAKGRILDLRRDEFAFRGDVAALGNLAWYGGVAALFFMLAGVVLFTVRTVQLRGELGALDERIAAAVVGAFPEVDPAKAADPSMARAIVQEKTEATRRQVEVLGELTERRPRTLEMLRKLSEAMPPPSEARIDVTDLTIAHGSAVNMKAETDGFEAAARIEAALKRSPDFRQATRGDEQKAREAVRFTINIPLGEPEAGEEG